ncbi:hypothetical protein ACHAXS_005526 [Conticribra weissflogii]
MNTTSCQDPVGVVGEWEFVGFNRSFAAPVCCGWDDRIVDKLCGNKPNTTFHRGNSDGSYQHLGGRGCRCSNFKDQYIWRSPGLSIRFDPIETCSLLRDRNVLFIGDSTMSQTATTLMNALIPGRCQTQIAFGSSDTLVGRPYGHWNRGSPWVDYVNRLRPEIVFVTAGAHISDDKGFREIVDEVLYDMKEMLLNKTFANTILAWKTQQPGGCTHDILFPHNPASFAAENISDFLELKYNWGQFYQRDLFLISRLQQVGIPYLDMRMLYSRTDAHVSSRGNKKYGDCLHLCAPGPLDVVARLFHQFLVNNLQ